VSAGLVLSLEIDQIGDADVVKIDTIQQIYGRDAKDINHLSGFWPWMAFMSAFRKSDKVVVPEMLMNKTGSSVAELMEERTLTERQMGRESI
jgi:hypothetical protein